MTQTPPNPTPPPNVEVLVEKNHETVAEIQESAEELGVVHTVLKTELREVMPSEDAELAVERARQVKEQLEATAAELKKATEALQQHTSSGKS